MVVQLILNQAESGDMQCTYPAHSHPEEQILINLKREKRIRVGNDWFNMEPGDVLVIPANTEHEGVSQSDNLYLDITNRIPGYNWHERTWVPGAQEDWKRVKSILEELDRKYTIQY